MGWFFTCGEAIMSMSYNYQLEESGDEHFVNSGLLSIL